MKPRFLERLTPEHLATAAKLGAGGCILGILLVDGETPSDNVSICFAYTLPILLGVYTGNRSAYALAAASTLATLVGSFIAPPREGIVPSFVANRIIAVVAQWLVAFLIEQHRRSSAIIRASLADERRKGETGRRFVRILTHEIGSALTSIGGQSYRLAKLADTIAPDDIVARSGKIQRAVARLDALVGRIRLASEVDQGDVPLRPETFDAAEFLTALCNEFDGEAEIRLELRDARTIRGDRDMLSQAISNVVGNAMKYAPRSAAITVSAGPSDVVNGTVVAVTDRGSGIGPDELSKVFEPYYRGANSGGVPGIGIGLYLVRHFVEAHAGRVVVTSRLGSGTTVSLHLPADETSEGETR